MPASALERGATPPPLLLRILDLIFSGLGLIAASLVIGVCAVVIKATSKGPAIFRQERVGRNRRPFVCLKLRTMHADTHSVASHEVGASAITPVGRFLRRTKLDELPQLWNVLKGEMSFVGPRPCLPNQIELIEARDRLGVYALRPGITGPAQIRGIDMSEPQRLADTDVSWVSEQAVGPYLRIILLTAFGRGQGDCAVQP